MSGYSPADLADDALAERVRAHVRHLVDDGDWSYARIGKHVGVSRSSVSCWLTTGRHPLREAAAAVLAMTADTPKPPGRNQPGRGPTWVIHVCPVCEQPFRAPFRADARRSRTYCGQRCAGRDRTPPDTSVRDAEIVRLYRENVVVSEIATATGVTQGTVYRALARADVPRDRPRGRRAGGRG